MNVHEHTYYERLDNGVDVFLLRTRVRDVVVCNMAFPGGDYATYNTQTIADLLETILPVGTRTRTRIAVREALDALGVSLSFQMTHTHLIVSLASRAAVFADALTLVVDMLTNPRVTPREFKEAVAQLCTAYEHAREDTRGRAGSTLVRSLYAPGHPHWVPLPSELRDEVTKIQARDVLNFHHATFSGVGAVVCIVGDFHEKHMASLVRDVCARVPLLRGVPVSVHPDRTVVASKKDEIISMREKMNIDTLLAIPLPITRDHASYHALMIGTSILGGSCSSRLFTSLRTKQSLTYGAYASLAGMTDGFAGYVYANAIFPNDVFKKGREALRFEVARWVEKGVTSGELARRKEELVGNHKVGLSATRGLASAMFGAVLSGRGLAYVDKYPTIVEAITLREVNAAIKTHVQYDLAVTAAAGSIDRDGTPL
ncbi:MAG: insulinase family protein [Candidatus Pacebacteria bacterium]|nr:insulinase family protein [Candidatus Paceibacterota bacterium]